MPTTPDANLDGSVQTSQCHLETAFGPKDTAIATLHFRLQLVPVPHLPDIRANELLGAALQI